MRVALVTHEVVKNHGQGRVNYELALYLAARGHDVHLFAYQVDDNLVDLDRITIHHIPVVNATRLVKGISFGLLAALALRRQTYDIVHSNGDAVFARSDVNTCHYCHSVAPVELRKGESSRIRTVYKTLYRAFHATLERRIYRHCTAVIAVSGRGARELAVSAHVPSERIYVVYNGVDLDEFRPASGQVSDRPQGLRLLFVGDLTSRRKGLDAALEALLDLPPKCTLSVVGSTTSSSYPNVVASNPMLAGRVHFLGFRQEMPEIYRTHDVLLFPSWYDPFGLVVLEAMASGLPVVVSARAGASEVIEHGVSGYILKSPSDTAVLVEHVKHLLNNGLSRERMGNHARQVAEQYSWQHMAEQIELLYEVVLRQNRTA